MLVEQIYHKEDRAGYLKRKTIVFERVKEFGLFLTSVNIRSWYFPSTKKCQWYNEFEIWVFYKLNQTLQSLLWGEKPSRENENVKYELTNIERKENGNWVEIGVTDNSDSFPKVLHCFKVNEEKLKTDQTTFVKIKIVSNISRIFLYLQKRLFRFTRKSLKNCVFFL